MKILKKLLLFSILGLSIFLALENYDKLSAAFKDQVENALDVIGRSDLNRLISTGEMLDIDLNISPDEIKLTGEEYSFDQEYYPYYGLLSDSEKKLYKQIYANVVALETTFTPIVEVSIVDMERIMESIYNDHPELFWLDTSYTYKYNSKNICVKMSLEFNETANNFDESKALYDGVVSTIVNAANKIEGTIEKERFVHDVLINGIFYDTNAPLNQSSYSALVNKTSVCAGYARAFQHIMTSLQIPTYFVSGSANGNHAWNIIKIDGVYYNVDLTWDDVEGDRLAYFNVSDVSLASHTREGLSLKLPECPTDASYKGNYGAETYNYEISDDANEVDEIVEYDPDFVNIT